MRWRGSMARCCEPARRGAGATCAGRCHPPTTAPPARARAPARRACLPPPPPAAGPHPWPHRPRPRGTLLPHLVRPRRRAEGSGREAAAAHRGRGWGAPGGRWFRAVRRSRSRVPQRRIRARGRGRGVSRAVGWGRGLARGGGSSGGGSARAGAGTAAAAALLPAGPPAARGGRQADVADSARSLLFFGPRAGGGGGTVGGGGLPARAAQCPRRRKTQRPRTAPRMQRGLHKRGAMGRRTRSA